MLLRSWIGANECAITRWMPDHFSHCGAVSRELPVPLRWPDDDDLEVAVDQRARPEHALPSLLRP